MARTQMGGELAGGLADRLTDGLMWLVRPLDGPSLLLLALVLVCGLLGLAARAGAGGP